MAAPQTLTRARRGSRWLVLATPGVPADRLRLAHSGVRPGAELTVLGRTAGGGGVLGVGTYRLAVDRGTLGALAVEPLA